MGPDRTSCVGYAMCGAVRPVVIDQKRETLELPVVVTVFSSCASVCILAL